MKNTQSATASNEMELKPCPRCGVPPHIGYACGEYFIAGKDPSCPICGHAFTEMHSNEGEEIKAWNRRAEAQTIEDSLKPCPFCGGQAEIGRLPDSDLYIIGCNDDFMCMGNINHMAMVFCTKETAAAAWNRRPGKNAGR